jgi:CBS domain-containing protein
MTLREVVHAHIPWLTEKSTLRDAVDKMDIYQFPALVLVDEEGSPLGVLTEGDLCRAIGQQGSLTALADEKAGKFATKDPVTAPADSEIGEALHLMLSRGITILPVLDEKKLAGVVLRVDLMQAILMDAGEKA